MAFYNRYLAQPVQKFVDLFGKVQPLDIVEYGGGSRATASVNVSTVAILAAPPAGSVYRLHRFMTADASSGNLLGTTSTQPYGFATAGVPVDNLEGQLAAEGLSAFANRAVVCILYYDLVTTPSIS